MAEVTMKVAIRVRPMNRREKEQNQKTIVRVMEDASTLIFDPEEGEDEFALHSSNQTHRGITKRPRKKITMKFDHVFHDETNNQDMFETCTKPIVQSVLEGFNCSIFAYGATGSGKTFTMLGSENNPGIAYLTLQELFAEMKLQREQKFYISVSYLEVYNEKVMNLLTKSGPLTLRENKNGVLVDGLVLEKIRNANELFDLLRLGNKNRTQHPTDANEESSKSHAIFQVHIRTTDRNTNASRAVKLSMIDLAGSEGAQSRESLRYKESALEGANINKSLIALGNCISKLAEGCKHIPYRDSNLTRILKDCLGQNCQTLMIANISPSSYSNTYNTLKYASRAKTIKTTCKRNILGTSFLGASFLPGTTFLPTSAPIDSVLKKKMDQLAEIAHLKIETKKRKIENAKLKIENEVMKGRIKMLDNETKADEQCNKENDSNRKGSGPRRRSQGSKPSEAMKIQESRPSTSRLPLGPINLTSSKKHFPAKAITEQEVGMKNAGTAGSAKTVEAALKVEKIAMVKEDTKASIVASKRTISNRIPKLCSIKKICSPLMPTSTVVKEPKIEFRKKLNFDSPKEKKHLQAKEITEQEADTKKAGIAKAAKEALIVAAIAAVIVAVIVAVKPRI